MNKSYIAVVASSVFLLAACGDPLATREVDGQQQNAAIPASVTFAVDLPENHSVEPAYIHSDTAQIRIQVYKSPVGSYEDLPQAMAAWYQCAIAEYFGDDQWLQNMEAEDQNFLDQVISIETDLASFEARCGSYPGGHAAQTPIETRTLTTASAMANFELEPGKYRFAVTQLKQDGTPMSWVNSYATLSSGMNEVSIKMLQGQWEVAADQPVNFKLLGLEKLNEVVADDLRLLFKDDKVFKMSRLQYEGYNWLDSLFNWSFINELPSATTPAEALGFDAHNFALNSIEVLGSNFNFVSGWSQPDPLKGWGLTNPLERLFPESGSEWIVDGYYGGFSEDIEESWLFTVLDPENDYCDSRYCLLDSYSRAAIAPHGNIFSATGGERVMNWTEVYDETNNRFTQGGISAPAVILQQFNGGVNKNRVSLGEMEVNIEPDYSKFQGAGLFFYGLNDQDTGFVEKLVPGQMNVMKKTGWVVDDVYSYGESSYNVYLINSYEVVWVDADFPQVVATQMLDGKTIQASVIEYVDFSEDYYVSLSDLIEVLPSTLPFDASYDEEVYGRSVAVPQSLDAHTRQKHRKSLINRALSGLLEHHGDASPAATESQSGCFVVYSFEHKVWATYLKNAAGQLEYDATNSTDSRNFEAALKVCAHNTSLHAGGL